MAARLDSERPVRWGILGAGAIAATVCAFMSASAQSEVVAVGSRGTGRAEAFARTHGIESSYGSYDALVAAPDVDVVYIATTHGQHRDQALLALRAGKALLVEKAFTLNARHAREVIAEARAQDLFCMEAMWTRVNPLVRAAADVVSSGRIGEVTCVRADLSKRFTYDAGHRLFDLAVGGGALLDLGVYPLHFVDLMLGRPMSISAVGRLSPTGSDLVSALQMSFRGGAVAQVHTSAASASPDGAVVLGTQGWVRLDGWMHHPSSVTIWTEEGTETIPATDYDSGYGPQVAEVERCLRAGVVESPYVPHDSTVAVLEVIDAARAQLGVRYAADAEGA